MGPVIMVIDDDRGIADLLSIMLKSNGYTPITASNGSVALNLLKHSPRPMLILTDYSMPVLNGCELIEILSNYSGLQHIPAIIMTGTAIDDLRLPTTNNFKGIIPKPFKISTVLDTIRYYLAYEDYNSSTCLA